MESSSKARDAIKSKISEKLKDTAFFQNTGKSENTLNTLDTLNPEVSKRVILRIAISNLDKIIQLN